MFNNIEIFMKKNLNIFLTLFFSLISFNSFASNGVKRITEMDRGKFFSCAPIYSKYKNDPKPKLKKLSEYSADLFAQYFALANKIGGTDMEAILSVVYDNDENPTPEELLRRGEAETRRQGIQLLNITRKK